MKIPWWRQRNLTKRQADAALLARSIPDLQEYAGAVLVIMKQIGMKTLVMHAEHGTVRIDTEDFYT